MSSEIPDILRTYFPQLSEPALQEAILTDGTVHTFRAGEMIMDFDSYIKMVPLVVRGSIKVSREDDEGNELFLYYLQPKEACSMSFSCCLANKRSAIRAIAEEETTIIGIPTQKVEGWMSQFSSWKNFVMRAYDERMMDLVKVIDSIAFTNMDERLLKYLNQKSTVTKSKVIQATHQEIAHDLNASREAISRLLKRLEKIGKVKLGRNMIELN